MKPIEKNTLAKGSNAAVSEDPEADILQPVGGGIRDVDSLFACLVKSKKTV